MSDEILLTRVQRAWDEKANSYDSVPGNSLQGKLQQRVWRELLRKWLQRESSPRVLDVACGTGSVANLLGALDVAVVGVDISPRMIEIATAKNRFECVDYCVSTAETLPFESNSFDHCVCRYAIWTMLNPIDSLKEMVRVVRPGGTILVIEKLRRKRGGLARHISAVLSPFRWLWVGAEASKTDDSYQRIIGELPFPSGISEQNFDWLASKIGELSDFRRMGTLGIILTEALRNPFSISYTLLTFRRIAVSWRVTK